MMALTLFGSALFGGGYFAGFRSEQPHIASLQSDFAKLQHDFAKQKADLTEASAQLARVTAEREFVKQQMSHLASRNVELEQTNRKFVSVTRAAVAASRAYMAVSARERCALSRQVAAQQAIVRTTVQTIVRTMQSGAFRRMVAKGAGWVPLGGDAVDTVITGATLIRDRQHAADLRNLNSAMSRAASEAARDCGTFTSARPV